MANPFKEAEKAKKKAPGSHQQAHEVKNDEVVAPVAQETPVEVVVETPVQPEPVVETEVKVEPVVEQTVAETVVKPEGKRDKKNAKQEKPALNIFANLGAEKPSTKTYAFYLSDENVAKLKKLAEKNGISASKLLDHILSEVL